ncbi:MAG: DUF424 family protein [Candidatus Methanomethylophilaceae archaeon]|nr:DUF424 family protein [Candidatus Methanomethylophilaceae archaeon]
MFVRIHNCDGEMMLAACDEDLIGMTFRGDGTRITVSERFYKGESVDATTLAERMKSVSIMNLVGDEVISVAISEGHVSEESIMVIGGIRYAQVVIM